MNVIARDEHSEVVRRHFDDVAREWEQHYTVKGSMLDRLDRFSKEVGRAIPPPAKLLDFGCGSGDLSRRLAAGGYEVTAVDQSRPMIERALARFNTPGLDFAVFQSAGGHRLPFADNLFSGCISSSVLEYLDPARAYLAEFRRVVRPGGILVVTVPNVFHPIRALERCELRAYSSLGAFASRLRKDRRDYLKASVNRLSPQGWREMMAGAGWSVRRVSGWRSPLLLFVCE